MPDMLNRCLNKIIFNYTYSSSTVRKAIFKMQIYCDCFVPALLVVSTARQPLSQPELIRISPFSPSPLFYRQGSFYCFLSWKKVNVYWKYFFSSQEKRTVKFNQHHSSVKSSTLILKFIIICTFSNHGRGGIEKN